MLLSETEKDTLRGRLRGLLGIPSFSSPPACEKRGQVQCDGFVVEKWIYESEPGSWVTALLYKPARFSGKIPAIIIANGHGESKSSLGNLYAGPLYAKLGVACLCTDPVGEEERHLHGGRGTRAHDDKAADTRATAAGRMMMGKLVLDCMRGVDFLTALPEIDSQKLGVAGVSLGCAISEWLTALDTRLRISLLASFGLLCYNEIGKSCTSTPFLRMLEVCNWQDLLSLFVPHSACLFLNGDDDTVMDPQLSGGYISSVREGVALLGTICRQSGLSENFSMWEYPGGGHRSYHLNREALLWINRWLGTPQITREQIAALPNTPFAQWCQRYGFQWEHQSSSLYWTTRHYAGASFVDLDVKPLKTELLQCLEPGQAGDPKFTLEGWLDAIEAKNHKK